ncbi:hypothetical protein Ancab_019612 [Ancistrocladus abbreviatus]
MCTKYSLLSNTNLYFQKRKGEKTSTCKTRSHPQFLNPTNNSHTWSRSHTSNPLSIGIRVGNEILFHNLEHLLHLLLAHLWSLFFELSSGQGMDMGGHLANAATALRIELSLVYDAFVLALKHISPNGSVLAIEIGYIKLINSVFSILVLKSCQSNNYKILIAQTFYFLLGLTP